MKEYQEKRINTNNFKLTQLHTKHSCNKTNIEINMLNYLRCTNKRNERDIIFFQNINIIINTIEINIIDISLLFIIVR